MSLARTWSKKKNNLPEFIVQDLFDDLRKSGQKRLGFLKDQYFAIGNSYRGKITNIDIDLSSESKRCDVFIVLVIEYINKKGVACSMRYRLNNIWSDEFFYTSDEDSLKLYLELKDK